MTDTISSGTPEGVPNHCPICDTIICIEPSHPPGDAPCPNCGTLLWFFQTSEGMRLYESKSVAGLSEKIMKIICDRLGTNKEITPTTPLHENVDSLELVELMMELEAEFGITIPDDQAEKIRTVGDVIDCIA
jgi:acyl carrier protein